MIKKRKLIDLDTTIVNKLTEQAKQYGLQVKPYIEKILTEQANAIIINPNK